MLGSHTIVLEKETTIDTILTEETILGDIVVIQSLVRTMIADESVNVSGLGTGTTEIGITETGSTGTGTRITETEPEIETETETAIGLGRINTPTLLAEGTITGTNDKYVSLGTL